MNMKYILFLTGILYSLTSSAQLSEYEQELLKNLASCVQVSNEFIASCQEFSAHAHQHQVASVNAENNILFSHYPALRKSLSYISMGDLPTPVQCCTHINAQLPSTQLWIKDDGKTGIIAPDGCRRFGGNKLRKLQYLLADAVAHGHTSVLTFGCAGSNHALQTTVCARRLGLVPFCMLLPQVNSHTVQRNLLLQQADGAQLCYATNRTEHAHNTAQTCYEQKQKAGQFPYIIPVGGSCALGSLGYVEAAFELKEQIKKGELAKPDVIYVTLGSGGTAAGLLLGLKAAQLDCKVRLVLIAPESASGTLERKVQTLFAEANALLQSHDASFPTCSLEPDDYEVITKHTGKGYGVFTPESRFAIDTLAKQEGITLDGTYTGKAFAAVLDDMTTGVCDGKTILFWNTFCGDDHHEITDTIDYHDLPEAFHRYFETPVQELDR